MGQSKGDAVWMLFIAVFGRSSNIVDAITMQQCVESRGTKTVATVHVATERAIRHRGQIGVKEVIRPARKCQQD